MNEKTGLIIGIGTLADYLNVSRPTIHKYLKNGMPGLYVRSDIGKRGTWHFHAENIETWWKVQTSLQLKSISDEMLEEDETIIKKKSRGNGHKKTMSRKNDVK